MQRLDIGDQVRVTGEGSDHEGATGYLICVDNGVLHYVATTTGDILLGPYARNELSAIVSCEWFIRCTNEATEIVACVVGTIPVCESCRNFARPDSYLD